MLRAARQSVPVACKKESSVKERGQVRLPDPETLKLSRMLYIESHSSQLLDVEAIQCDCFSLKALQGEDHNLNTKHLRVRKVGLPPLFRDLFHLFLPNQFRGSESAQISSSPSGVSAQ